MQPLPAATRYSGTCILISPAPGSPYSGTWTDGGDYHAIHFDYDPLTKHATAWGDFSLGAKWTPATWSSQAIGAWPNVNYFAMNPETTFWRWKGELVISG